MKRSYIFFALAALATIAVWKNRYLLMPIPEKANTPISKPMLVSHRGIGNGYPESTVPAFTSAFAAGADSIELDVHLTKDQQIVVLHDSDIFATTNGRGAVNKLTVKQIKRYSIRDAAGKVFPKLTIPTLEEVLRATEGSPHYYIELKGADPEHRLVMRTLDILEAYGLLDPERITMQSFDEEKLLAVKKRYPTIPCTLLFRTYRVNRQKALSHPFENTGLESRDVSSEFVQQLHQAGKEVHVFFIWGFLAEREQQRLRTVPIDGYFTDDLTYTKKLFYNK